jgi:hypothetical protein
MGGESRVSKGVTPDGPNSSTGTYHERHYEASDVGMGLQLGLRAGATHASVGDMGSGNGFGVDAHADFVVAGERWGAGLTGGYTSDRVFFSGEDISFVGFPIAAYGQFAVHPRFILHAGSGYVLGGSIVRQEANGRPGGSVDANAVRAFGGMTWVFSRESSRDFSLRIEARGNFGADAAMDGQRMTWNSLGVLAEIVWVTF